MKPIPNKLSPEDRELIKSLAAERKKLEAQLAQVTNAAIARKFEVDISTIQNFLRGSTYKNDASIPPESGAF